MRRSSSYTAGALISLALLIPLCGCGGAIAGRWELARAEPNREVFSIDDAVFRRDGTFVATTTHDGLTNEERGTYSFNGWELKLRPEAGGQRTYGATVKLGALRVRDGDRYATLRKVKGDG